MTTVTKAIIKFNPMRNIKILGIGSSKYRQLTYNLFVVINELGIEAEVEQFNEIEDFIRFSIVKIPTLIIDGEVIAKGSVPNIDELTAFFKEEHYKQEISNLEKINKVA